MTGVKVARKRVEGLDGRMPAVDAAHVTLSQRLAAVEALLPMAALRAHEDEEYVHQLRVASRRADAALRIFQPFVDRKAYLKARKGLKKIRQAAGEARECDVHAHLLEELTSPGEGGRHLSDQMLEHRRRAIESLRVAMQAERETAQQAIVNVARKYHGRKLSKVQSKLLKSLAPVNLERDGDGEQSMTFAALARSRLEQFANAVREHADDALQNDAPIAALHALRIRAKRLRYAMEVFAPCFADGLKSAYKRVEAMQDALGEINDLDDLSRRVAMALKQPAKKQSMNRAAAFTLEEHAGIDALRQQLACERDARANRFVRELGDGAWDDVVHFDTPIADAQLAFSEPEDGVQEAEVRA